MGQDGVVSTTCIRDRGLSLSTFIALLVPILLLSAGLVIDGGAHTTAVARAESAAAEAARAGVNAGAGHQLLGLDADRVALEAARASLQQRGVEGSATIEGGTVRVRTRTSASTTFLSIIGITTLRATGEASADLHAQ